METNINYQEILEAIRNNGGTISASGLMRLIAATNAITCPTLVVLHNYTSEKSDNQELADYKLNVGTKYENAKEISIRKVESLTPADLPEIQALCTPDKIKGFQYINRKGLTENDYCNQVKIAIPQAIAEMQTVTDRPNSAVIHLNKVLTFNRNTGNLLLSGELTSGGKIVKVEQETPKMTAKAPKTVAKEVVKTFLGARSNKIRSFNLIYLNTISINKQKIPLVEV